MDKTARTLVPRDVRLFVMVTKDVRQRLERLAKARGWSLSLTGYKAILAGLDVVEQLKGAE